MFSSRRDDKRFDQSVSAIRCTVGAVIFDFRYKNAEGKWKASGHCKGATRDAAFDALEQKKGGMPDGRYMSRPRDGHAKDWDLFSWPRAASAPAQEPWPSGVHSQGHRGS